MSECKCERCGECNGSGTIWFDFQGNYLGHHRCDDLDEPDNCPECSGSGIIDQCDHCNALEEDEWSSS